jgi:hypothetical protein
MCTATQFENRNIVCLKNLSHPEFAHELGGLLDVRYRHKYMPDPHWWAFIDSSHHHFSLFPPLSSDTTH